MSGSEGGGGGGAGVSYYELLGRWDKKNGGVKLSTPCHIQIHVHATHLLLIIQHTSIAS